MVQKDVRFKLIEHTFLEKISNPIQKLEITLSEKPKEKIKSRSVDKNDP